MNRNHPFQVGYFSPYSLSPFTKNYNLRYFAGENTQEFFTTKHNLSEYLPKTESRIIKDVIAMLNSDLLGCPAPGIKLDKWPLPLSDVMDNGTLQMYNQINLSGTCKNFLIFHNWFYQLIELLLSISKVRLITKIVNMMYLPSISIDCLYKLWYQWDESNDEESDDNGSRNSHQFSN